MKFKQRSPKNTLNHNHPALSPIASAIKVAVVGIGLAAHSVGQAATIEVNSISDNGSGCTLRDAVISINDGVLRRGCSYIGADFGTADTINIAAPLVSDTINLTRGSLDIEPDTAVSINGNGVTLDASQLLTSVAISANLAKVAIDQVNITGGGIAISDSIVSFSNGTISGSRYSGIVVNSDLYVLYNDDSSLSVTNSTITGNARHGIHTYGDVFDYSGIYVSVTDSVISGNSTSGIYVSYTTLNVANTAIVDNAGTGVDASRGRLDIVNSSVSGNSGGGIDVWDSSLLISNCMISDNSTSKNGGGIYFIDSPTSISNSTVSNNSALMNGGGIYNRSGALYPSDLNITNSTISGNSAVKGGAIFTDNDISVNIRSSTISGNTGGGVHFSSYSSGAAPSVTIRNSIIANSRGGGNCSNPTFLTFPDQRLPRAVIEIGSASIIEDGSCGTSARAVDPILLPLADNGCTVMHATLNGPACVVTHALGAGSPAIDTANSIINSNLAFDQIGTERPQGGASDVGAFELSPIVPTAPGFSVTAEDAIEGDKVLFTITLDEPQPTQVAYDFNTMAGTAVDGEDYVGRVGRVLFPVGETVRERRVTILEDSVQNEGDETFSLVVTDINDPSATITTQATIKEQLPELSVAQVRVREGDGQAVVAINLSEPSDERVTVKFRTFVRPTQNNPATDGEDYVGRSGTIVFPAGATRRTRTITLIDDAIDEANEVFRFELSDPVNSEIEQGSERQRIFILDDD